MSDTVTELAVIVRAWLHIPLDLPYSLPKIVDILTGAEALATGPLHQHLQHARTSLDAAVWLGAGSEEARAQLAAGLDQLQRAAATGPIPRPRRDQPQQRTADPTDTLERNAR
ncbi:hypothetical protein [Streptomyces sp. cg36]|uniref:hypothetical protein n=1 Tax=Streptomyces sp. cg36 TaxID=3238798 RepID=UPI0034E29269